jgi:hypothetical protein
MSAFAVLAFLDQEQSVVVEPLLPMGTSRNKGSVNGDGREE